MGFFVGVNDVARKIKNLYVGIDNAARKVKKMYVGVGGVARPCFSSEKQLVYYGVATVLSVSRRSLESAFVGNRLLFAGGTTTNLASGVTNIVDSYSGELVKTTLTSLMLSRSNFSSVSMPDYAVFAGGWDASGQSVTNIDIYNSSFTRNNSIYLVDHRRALASALAGSYALIAGGYSGTNGVRSTVESISSSLVRGTQTSLSVVKEQLSGASINNQAIFAGGANGAGALSSVDVYSPALIKTVGTELSQPRQSLSSAESNSHILFGGGREYITSTSSYVYKNTVDAYNSSLTRLTPMSLISSRSNIAAKYIDGFYIFDGGYSDSGYVSTTDVFNNDLVRTSYDGNTIRAFHSSGVVGKYLIIAGGSPGGAVTLDKVDVYTVL